MCKAVFLGWQLWFHFKVARFIFYILSCRSSFGAAASSLSCRAITLSWMFAFWWGMLGVPEPPHAKIKTYLSCSTWSLKERNGKLTPCSLKHLSHSFSGISFSWGPHIHCPFFLRLLLHWLLLSHLVTRLSSSESVHSNYFHLHSITRSVPVSKLLTDCQYYQGLRYMNP